MYDNFTEHGPNYWYIDAGDGPEILGVNDFKLELTSLGSLSILGASVVAGSLAVSAGVGSYCKCAIYQYMYNKAKETEIKPIDILILVNAITQNLICLFLAVFYCVGLVGDITFSDHLDEIWCNLPWYAGIYGGAYRAFGSLGMAVYRLILIKRNNWVITIGKKTLCFIVLLFSLMMSIACTVGFGLGNGPASRKQVTWNWCVGRNENFREILHGYSLITGAIEHESESLAKYSLLTTLFGAVAELCCYLLFFSHLHANDKGLFTRKIIQEVEYKRRRQVNCITFSGQFYGFIVECTTYIGMLTTLKKNSNISFRLLLAICFWVEFGIVSVVEVMTSQHLRRNLPHNRYHF